MRTTRGRKIGGTKGKTKIEHRRKRARKGGMGTKGRTTRTTTTTTQGG